MSFCTNEIRSDFLLRARRLTDAKHGALNFRFGIRFVRVVTLVGQIHQRVDACAVQRIARLHYLECPTRGRGVTVIFD